ncbi:molybdate ABC transporter substrate-binding protein [Dehalococcoidia bacterium]|nr:molybdate ABC transporter substrate-binding protein [Dehalococcoidia bacterium]
MSHRTSVKILSLIIIASIALFGCDLKAQDDKLLVFVAASLTNVVLETKNAFEKQSGAELIFNIAGSQTLAGEIAHGAPADVFISAGPKPMSFLVERNKVDSHSVRGVAGNLLVIAVSSEGDYEELRSIEQLATMKRVAIADPDLAPAGRYAKESLTTIGLWEKIYSTLIYAADVRAALAYVQTGNVDAAIVYSTDLVVAEGVLEKNIIPESSYSKVTYPGAIVIGSNKKALAEDYFSFLHSEQVASIFKKHGFLTVDSTN